MAITSIGSPSAVQNKVYKVQPKRDIVDIAVPPAVEYIPGKQIINVTVNQSYGKELASKIQILNPDQRGQVYQTAPGIFGYI